MNITKNMDVISKLIADVKYKDWVFKVRPSSGGYLLAISTDAETVSNIQKAEAKYHHRLGIHEWYISRFATDTEVIRTVYKAVMYIEMFIVDNTGFIDINRFNELVYSKEITSNEDNNKVRMRSMLSAFKYKNWQILHEEREGGTMVQIVFEAEDNEHPGDIEMQHCRKFLFNNYADLNELYSILKYALRTAEEHECNEQFIYKGQQIYNPHIDIDSLVEFVVTNEFDRRQIVA